MLVIVILYATVLFLVSIVVEVIEKLHQRGIHITLPLLHEVFAGFLMILIGLELMKSIVMYMDEHVIHVEVAHSVAIFAIARHAIYVDFNNVPPLAMIGIGAIIVALAIGYYYSGRPVFLTHN